MTDPPPAGNESRANEFVRLLALHERRLAACVLTLVLDWDRANDILQETKLKLWEQFDQYDSSKDFGAWSRTIARYLVMKHRDKSARDHVLVGQEYLDAISMEVDSLAEGVAERQSALAKCIEQLPPNNRELLRHCYLPSATFKQVAAQLNRTPGSVYKAVERIRLQLYRCVENKLGKEAAT